MQAAGPGPVRVTGHTDDQGGGAYNLDLSNRRAQAVAEALAGALPPDRYPPQVQGLGEQQPGGHERRSAGGQPPRRAARGAAAGAGAGAGAAQPPPGGGPHVLGEQGLSFTQSDGGVVRLAAEGAEREGDWLRVDLSAVVESTGGGDTNDLLVDLRDVTRGTRRADASGIGVLDGGTLLLPAVVEDDACACANTLFGLSAVESERRAFSVYVQAPATNSSTLTVQLPPGAGPTARRAGR